MQTVDDFIQFDCEKKSVVTVDSSERVKVEKWDTKKKWAYRQEAIRYLYRFWEYVVLRALFIRRRSVDSRLWFYSWFIYVIF